MTPEMTIAEREGLLLAPYATFSVDYGGRARAEPPHPLRGPFQRDRDRILHCAAFRRLSQKTQVFTGHQHGDYHRTRLTHTLEATSIARTIGRALRLNEDLIEALTLMHDIGHPPFGHAGEDALDHALRDHGGFNHNAQALRIVELLEQRAPRVPGLNLSAATLAGQRDRSQKTQRIVQPYLEAQVVDAADSLAYDSHDPDDALRYGILTLRELDEVPFWRAAVERVRQMYAAMDEDELRRAAVHELIDWQVSDLIAETRRLLAERPPANRAAIAAAEPYVTMSGELRGYKLELERFLRERVYRHPALLATRKEYQAKLHELFELLRGRPEQMPQSFQARLDAEGLERTIGDYLAGMTDRFAMQEWQRFQHTKPPLVSAGISTRKSNHG
jgi:dGTPase